MHGHAPACQLPAAAALVEQQHSKAVRRSPAPQLQRSPPLRFLIAATNRLEGLPHLAAAACIRVFDPGSQRLPRSFFDVGSAPRARCTDATRPWQVPSSYEPSVARAWRQFWGAARQPLLDAFAVAPILSLDPAAFQSPARWVAARVLAPMNQGWLARPRHVGDLLARNVLSTRSTSPSMLAR